MDPIFEFYHPGDNEHTYHLGDPWSKEQRKEVQFFAFREPTPDTVMVQDFWNSKDKEHTFHTGGPWGHNETVGGSKFYAYEKHVPGTEAVYDFWNNKEWEHTLHLGEARHGEERGNIQFYAFPEQLKWNGGAQCQGSAARDRAKWLMDNEGMNEEAAQRKVMGEFPDSFRAGVYPSISPPAVGGDLTGWVQWVDGDFPHTLSIVKDGNGKNRLRIAVTPRNPDEVSLVAVHYGINTPGEAMNFDIKWPEAGTNDYVHVTPDFGPECNGGEEVHYWLGAEVNREIMGFTNVLIQSMPEQACRSGERLTWTAY